MKKLIFIFWLVFFSLSAHAFQPLSTTQAFALSTKIAADNHSIVATWKIAPGYHLYREHFTFDLSPSNIAQAGKIVLPPGIAKNDNVLGNYQVYEKTVAITIPIVINKSGDATLTVGYQGCADSGFCYPPVSKQLSLSSNGKILTTLNAAAPQKKLSLSATPTITPSTSLTEQDRVTRLLIGDNWALILLGFLGFGFLLAFTPCVLPMIPILSSIIVGEGKSITVGRGFGLSLAYVLAMAITYACAGVLAGLAGSYVQAFLQNPWVIAIFSAVFVLLALSLFGLYELRMPNFLHHHVTKLSNKQSGGSYIGVAVMGCLATLIVSPCVTAPLLGALSYIGKTGNAVLGGSALFALGIGMGIPLLVIGTLGGEFLPKAGTWMDTIKGVFGVLMLAMAILLLSRIVLPHVTMLMWATLFIISGVYMGAFVSFPRHSPAKLWKGASLILVIYGVILLVGASLGNSDPFQPLAIKQAIPVSNIPQAQSFKVVTNINDLQQAIATAKAEDKPIMIDYYADWCMSCKQLDNNVFSDPNIQRKLNHYALIRADVTANNDDSRAMEKYFNVVAPPTILFLDSTGQELSNSRIVGEIGAKDFLGHIQQCSGG